MNSNIENDGARWDAVVKCDRNHDGSFVYAVKTTGVFCLPSCPSRKPNRQNVEFFASTADAIVAGYRPCKRCRPTKGLDDQRLQSVVSACRLIESRSQPPSLRELADCIGLSPHYFHRIFVQTLGVTPVEYARMKRDERMRNSLVSSDNVTASVYEAGFNSISRFYEQSSKMLGMQPSDFRSGGEGEAIHFSIGECSLGQFLVAATEAGVCAISLGDNEELLLNELQDRFEKAELIGSSPVFERYVAMIVAFVETPKLPLELPLDIRGTAFQRRVWKALLATSPGETLSYGELARRVGAPKAVRAVAGACAANEIALAIPCHRVVRTDGSLSGYRWGIQRKRELLNRESQLCD